MPQTCSICKHPRKKAINAELVRGASYRDIAGRFGVSSSAVERHMDHVAELVAKKRDSAEESIAEELQGELRMLRGETLAVLERAKTMGDTAGDCSTCERAPRLALQAVSRLERQAELQARLLGALQDRTVVHSSLFDEDWVRLRAVLLDALRPFPEASQAVLDALAKAGDRAS